MDNEQAHTVRALAYLLAESGLCLTDYSAAMAAEETMHWDGEAEGEVNRIVRLIFRAVGEARANW